MDSYIKEVLENAGWYEGRRVDIDYMIEELQRGGFEIKNHNIIQLLKEFWNLNIEYQTPTGNLSNIRLNTEVVNGVEKSVVDKISVLLHDELLPVGLIKEDSALLLVSNSEAFYMAAENEIYRLGDNFFAALSTIIYEKEVVRFSFA
jgi:hypothetical protein